jgi:hypothetical protein
MPIFNPVLVGKKLPTLTTPGVASDLASGKQLIGQDGEIVTGNVPVVTELSMTGTPSVSGSNLVIGRPSTMRVILPYQVPVEMDAPLTSLGDAAAADVASGKTFTSAAGVKVTGTAQKAPTFTAYTHYIGMTFNAYEPTDYSPYALNFYIPNSVSNLSGRSFKVYVGSIISASNPSASDATKGAFYEMNGSTQYFRMYGKSNQSYATYCRTEASLPVAGSVGSVTSYDGGSWQRIAFVIRAKFWASNSVAYSGASVPFRLEVY